MTTPLVSVLITSYNREKYIAEAIESVLASTFKDFELIIVDDCSKDRTVEIARRYLSDPRVQIHVNEKNLGQFQNRNRAASLAVGKYLKYLDSDDLIYPHGLEVMVRYMEQFPEAGLGVSEEFHYDRIHPKLFSSREAWRQGLFGGGVIGKGPTSIIIRREAFEQNGGFHHFNTASDDVYFQFELAARWPVVAFQSGLNFYRVHGDGQACKEQTPELNMLHNVKYMPELMQSNECPLTSEERDLAYSNLMAGFTRLCVRHVLRGRLLRAWGLWRTAKRPWSDWRFVTRRLSLPCKPKLYWEI